jgi:hydrogenase nickel incorporation protein HypA/HybF
LGLSRVHELGITEDIVAAVAERAAGATVTGVRLEIGALSGVAADSVRFCFELLAEGTNLASARLEIALAEGRCRCRDCGAEFAPDWPILACPCGSADVAILSGEGVRIIAIESHLPRLYTRIAPD